MLSLESPVSLTRLCFSKVLCLSSQASATHCETDSDVLLYSGKCGP